MKLIDELYNVCILISLCLNKLIFIRIIILIELIIVEIIVYICMLVVYIFFYDEGCVWYKLLSILVLF